MIGISTLREYFPTTNKPILIGKFTFRIDVDEDESTFILNLKIKTKGIPEEHIIKFRFGMGKDKFQSQASHPTDKPHFEIKTYARGETSTSTTIYFTFQDPENKQLLNFAKGTIVLIDKIIEYVLNKNDIPLEESEKIIHSEAVKSELEPFEETLISALAESFKQFDLIIREGKEGVPIKTTHKLKQSLSSPELEPLLLPLLAKIEANSLKK